jgi:hypothetical protein
MIIYVNYLSNGHFIIQKCGVIRGPRFGVSLIDNDTCQLIHRVGHHAICNMVIFVLIKQP